MDNYALFRGQFIKDMASSGAAKERGPSNVLKTLGFFNARLARSWMTGGTLQTKIQSTGQTLALHGLVSKADLEKKGKLINTRFIDVAARESQDRLNQLRANKADPSVLKRLEDGLTTLTPRKTKSPKTHKKKSRRKAGI
jgi:hypothetical protein